MSILDESGLMKIVEFKIYTIEIPMRISVSHALAKRKIAKNILVCVQDEDGLTGWGECCPRPYVTGETIDSVKKDLTENILPYLTGKEFSSLEHVKQALIYIIGDLNRNQQAAFCASEIAVLDLAGKSFGTSAGMVIGPVIHNKIRYSGVIATSKPAKVKKYALLMRLFGLTQVKVKVVESLDLNLEILKTARSVLGPKVSLRIDANCAWSADESIRQLEAMRHYNIRGVEQPVAANDLEGMKKVTAAKIVPVVADESLCSVKDCETLIKEKGCDIFNIRISKCGGIINSFRIYRLAINAGLKCQLGAQVGETGILSAAGRHLATRCDSIKWFEGSYGNILLKQDITKPGMTIGFGGWARALSKPGLGIEPIESVIAKYKTDTIEIK